MLHYKNKNVDYLYGTVFSFTFFSLSVGRWMSPCRMRLGLTAPCMLLSMFTMLVVHLWRTVEKFTMQLSSPPTSLPHSQRGRETCRRYNRFFRFHHITFTVHLNTQPSYLKLVPPSEVQPQIGETCIPLETSTVSYFDVWRLPVHQGGASQWCTTLHENVSHMKLSVNQNNVSLFWQF